MVILVDGRRYSTTNYTSEELVKYFCSIPSIQEATSAFISDIRKISSEVDLLYVHQGEMAVVPISDANHCTPKWLASDDATSCILMVLRLPNNHIIAHLDHPNRVRKFFIRISSQIESANDTTPIHVHLVGAFPDKRGLACATLLEVLKNLLSPDSREYLLKTFCVDQLNTSSGSSPSRPREIVQIPRVTGLLFNCQRDTAHAATVAWEARGPVPALRLARLQSSCDFSMTEVFDHMNNALVVEPFTYHDFQLMDPETLTIDQLRAFSTTPDQEPMTFFQGLRAVLALISRHPDSIKSWFSEGPLRFVYVSGDGGSTFQPADRASAHAHTHTSIKK